MSVYSRIVHLPHFKSISLFILLLLISIQGSAEKIHGDAAKNTDNGEHVNQIKNVTLSGNVYDSEGNPVEDVIIGTLHSIRDYSQNSRISAGKRNTFSPTAGTRSQTDKAGYFEIEYLLVKENRLVFSKPGYADTEFRGTGFINDLTRITINRLSSFRFRVFSETDYDPNLIRIHLGRPSGYIRHNRKGPQFTRQVPEIVDNEYIYNKVRPGKRRLSIRHPGCADHESVIDLPPGKETDLGTITLKKELPFEGYLKFENGEPVVNAKVNFYGKTPPINYSAYSKDAGFFTYSGMNPGEYTYCVFHDAVRKDNFNTIEITESDIPVEIVCETRSTVYGTVYGLNNAPVSAGSVSLNAYKIYPGIINEAIEGAAEIDPNGSYRMDSINPGTYCLKAEITEPELVTIYSLVTIETGGACEINPAAGEGSCLSGTISGAGRDLLDRRISVRGPMSFLVNLQDNYSFKICGLLPGRYSLFLTPKPYDKERRFHPVKEFKVDIPESSSVALTMDIPVSIISGRASYISGSPANKSTIELYYPSPKDSTYTYGDKPCWIGSTNSDGTFSIRIPGEGPFDISARNHYGFAAKSAGIQGSRGDIELTIEPIGPDAISSDDTAGTEAEEYGSLEVSVYQDREPAGYAAILGSNKLHYIKGLMGHIYHGRKICNRYGYQKFYHVPVGTYTIYAFRNGLTSDKVNLEIREDETTSITLQLNN